MRKDPATGKLVPGTLGELKEWFSGEVDPKVLGPDGRKDDVLTAIDAMVEFERGGERALINPALSHEQLCAELVVKSAQFSRARIREAQEANGPNDETMLLAGAVVRTGDRKKMLAFAEELEKTLLHPSVHPSKHHGIRKLAAWVRMNGKGNC
jgi:hypothetical protein